MKKLQVLGFTPKTGAVLKKLVDTVPSISTGRLQYSDIFKQSLAGKKATAENRVKNDIVITDWSEKDEDGNILAYKIAVANRYYVEHGSVSEKHNLISGKILYKKNSYTYAHEFISPPLEKGKNYYVFIVCDTRKVEIEGYNFSFVCEIKLLDMMEPFPDDDENMMYSLLGNVYILKKEKDGKEYYEMKIVERYKYSAAEDGHIYFNYPTDLFAFWSNCLNYITYW
jgi:hypothetical protein